MSRVTLIGLAASILALTALISVSAYLYSMTRWALHRKIAFEGDSIRVPAPWVSGENGHLFSIQRPALTLFSEPSKSTIAIDNFAEHWHSDALDGVSELWLKLHGHPIQGITSTGEAQVPSDLRCVSPELNMSRRISIQIYCLSADSVHSYEFFGAAHDIPSFFDIAAQAVRIGNKHPGRVFRPVAQLFAPE